MCILESWPQWKLRWKCFVQCNAKQIATSLDNDFFSKAKVLNGSLGEGWENKLAPLSPLFFFGEFEGRRLIIGEGGFWCLGPGLGSWFPNFCDVSIKNRNFSTEVPPPRLVKFCHLFFSFRQKTNIISIVYVAWSTFDFFVTKISPVKHNLNKNNCAQKATFYICRTYILLPPKLLRDTEQTNESSFGKIREGRGKKSSVVVLEL